MEKSKLNKAYLVTKRNALNEMRSKEMTLQELRLFSVYLSKINPRDKNTRLVRFDLSDFQNLMELQEPNILYFKKVAHNLVGKTIDVPTESGGFSVFNIFKECTVDADESGKWYVEIDANDKALPLLFDFKGHYFKYELWNALRLKGKNQLRLYEILKQHERTGYRIISIANLKGMLGISEKEYPQFKHFKQNVLEVCKKALAENTDISFTYEPHSKKSRKIYELKFTITKNKDYVDPLQLDRFIREKIDLVSESEDLETPAQPNDNAVDENGLLLSTGTHPIYEERITFLREACNNEFSREEMIVIYSIMQQKVPHIHSDANESHDYLQHKYRELELSNARTKVEHRFAYFRKLVESGEG